MPYIGCGRFGCSVALPMAVLAGALNAERPSTDVAEIEVEGPQPRGAVNAKVLRMIHGYQRHGVKLAKCRFEPSCSVNAERCFESYPFGKASLKTVWRLARCNPWNRGPTIDRLS